MFELSRNSTTTTYVTDLLHKGVPWRITVVHNTITGILTTNAIPTAPCAHASCYILVRVLYFISLNKKISEKRYLYRNKF